MKKVIATTAILVLLSATPAGAAPTWTTVNSTSTGDQDNAAVSAVRSGYTAVVWEDDRDNAAPEDPLHSDIWLRLYRNGVSQYEKKLSAGGTGNWTHVQPDVSLHDDGSAVVAWSEDPDGNGYYNIAVRVVRTDGTVAGSARANAETGGQQSRPAVAADPDSAGFAVAWEDKQSTTNPTVRVAGFASVTSKTYEVQAHANGGTHQRPDVAMGAAGNAIVVWDEDADANGAFNISRKVLTPTGSVKVAQDVANAATDGQQRNASVAANFNGDFAIAWETNHTGTPQTATRSFNATATPQSAVDTTTPGTDPQIGIDDQRSSAVATTTNADIHVQGFNPDGTTTGRLARQPTVQTAIGKQDEPALGVDAWGLITVVYTDDNDGNNFDQIYLGTGWQNTSW